MSRKVITDNLALAGKRRVIPRWKKLVYLLVRVMLLAFLVLSFYYGESYFRITSVLVEGNKISKIANSRNTLTYLLLQLLR